MITNISQSDKDYCYETEYLCDLKNVKFYEKYRSSNKTSGWNGNKYKDLIKEDMMCKPSDWFKGGCILNSLLLKESWRLHSLSLGCCSCHNISLIYILHADPLSFPRPRSRGRLFFPKITRCFHSKCSKIGGKLKFTRCFSLKVSK